LAKVKSNKSIKTRRLFYGISQDVPFHVPPIESQSAAPDATLVELDELDELDELVPLASLGSLGSLGELAALLADAAEPPSDACAIDIVVNAGMV
jgi:hypothetical protein